MPFFALSSGTTSGTTKYIPCSTEMNRASTRAALDVLVHHVADRPASRVLAGKSFMLGGSTDLVEQTPGVHCGDLSGIAVSQIPRWAQRYSFPPRELALISDWEAKVEALVSACRGEDIRVISGTSSWLLIFFERLLARQPGSRGNLNGVFHHLELLVHGGQFCAVSVAVRRVAQGRTCGTSRGLSGERRLPFAIADRGSGEGMRLLVDNGLFYEFVAVGELAAGIPKRNWLADAQTGVNYALVITSCAGLWSYVVGDTIRLVDLHPPRVLVTGRLSYFLSAFGEHPTGEEIEAAVSAAADIVHVGVADFSVGAVYPDIDDTRVDTHTLWN
jgi:GH3 auxin-responsive promoter